MDQPTGAIHHGREKTAKATSEFHLPSGKKDHPTGAAYSRSDAAYLWSDTIYSRSGAKYLWSDKKYLLPTRIPVTPLLLLLAPHPASLTSPARPLSPHLVTLALSILPLASAPLMLSSTSKRVAPPPLALAPHPAALN